MFMRIISEDGVRKDLRNTSTSCDSVFTHIWCSYWTYQMFEWFLLSSKGHNRKM